MDTLLGVESIPVLRGHEDGSGSGMELPPVLRGHKDCVTSVAFSVDNTRIISGSNDSTMSGAEILPVLRGQLYSFWTALASFLAQLTKPFVYGMHFLKLKHFQHYENVKERSCQLRSLQTAPAPPPAHKTRPYMYKTYYWVVRRA